MKDCFRIPYPASNAGKKQWASTYGMNAYYSGKHFSKRQADARFWHTLTVAAMNAAKIRKAPFEKPVVITFLWNDRLDLDNHAVMGKMIVDALKDRLIHDDSRRWVKGIGHFWHDADYISVSVQEIEEETQC